MAKKAPAKKAPAKRKPRNSIVDSAPQLAELAKRMEAERARILAEIAAKEAEKTNPVEPFELSELSPGTIRELRKILDGDKVVIDQAIREAETHLVSPAKSIAWRSWIVGGAKAVALIVAGLGGGVWWAGGIPIGPGPQKPDAVSAVFDSQESAFRSLSAERAKALRAGELKSESESVAWMQSRFLPACEAEWAKLLTAEAAEFGGEKWTAEKEAAAIERYVR